MATRDLQLRALTAAGCEIVCEDRISGAAVKRPGLDQVLAGLGEGDVLIVWRLDRLGRSLPHLATGRPRLFGQRKMRGLGPCASTFATDGKPQKRSRFFWFRTP